MKFQNFDSGDDIRRYCAKIGSDPLLVQGAGGNISWKSGEMLWVKASGTWLADAEGESIFVPVDLDKLRIEVSIGNFSARPEVIGHRALRPSIETMLHALMPHPVVLHLHAIELLAHLVRADPGRYFGAFLDKAAVSWSVVDYHRPGACLAAAVCDVLARQPSVDVIFLKNHGVVIGGRNIVEVDRLLRHITRVFATEPLVDQAQLCSVSDLPENLFEQYIAVPDLGVQQLALNPLLFGRLKTDWALYPDHVVFLGARAHMYLSWEAFLDDKDRFSWLPELIFVLGEGVYARSSLTKAQHAQLRCYFDVIARQKPADKLIGLSDAQIADLLDWDMERYRVGLSG